MLSAPQPAQPSALRFSALNAAVPWLLSTGLLLGSSLAAAQQADSEDEQESPQAEFADIINVKVVNVIVYVRDKKTGEPITGLTVGDFVLLEDKDPVKITNFYEVSEGRRTDEPELVDEGAEQLARLRSHPDLDPRRSRVSEDRRLHLIVYVDHFNIRPHNRNRVFRHLRQFLRTQLTREDRVALVSYNRSVKIERGFSSDAQLISNALFELERHTGGRTQLDSDRMDLLRELKDARDPGMVESRIRLHAESQFNDLQFTLDGIKELVESLAGIPGRKALLYVSDGLPMRPGEDMFVAATERYPDDLSSIRLDSLRYDASRRFNDIINSANANEVSFYTLDATGLLGRDSRGAEVSDNVFSTNVDSVFQNNMQSTIMYMADETGGQYIVNSNNFTRGFERFGFDFKHYYSLGFSPPHAGSGRLYRLEVQVKDRKGLEIRHRESYRDKSIEREMEDATLASLQFGVERNDLGISLHPNDMIRRSDGNYTVQLDVRVPIGELVLLPRENFHESRLRVWVQARDEKGNLSDPRAAPFSFQVPHEELEAAREKYYTYTLPLMMRAGDHRITVAVRDDFGARSSLISRTLRIGS